MEIKNIGALKEISFDFKKMVILTGENNTGKTHLSYLLYGILSSIFNDITFDLISEEIIRNFLFDQEESSLILKYSKEEIIESYITQSLSFIDERLKDITIQTFKIQEGSLKDLYFEISRDEIRDMLNYSFNYKSKTLSTGGILIKIETQESDIIVTLQQDEINHDMMNDREIFPLFLSEFISSKLLNLPSIFYFPAERNGINVFKNELNERRLKAYDSIMHTIEYVNLKSSKDKSKIRKKLLDSNFGMLFDSTSSNMYPKPISDYISFLNEMKNTSLVKDDTVGTYIRGHILDGKYEIDDNDKSVVFRHRYGNSKYRTSTYPFHVLSSSIKSLFGLDYYLDNHSRTGDIIIIDEPELNLHPQNQIKIARAISKIARSNIKVLISTHSDTILREIVNLILENKVNEKEGLVENDVIMYTLPARNDSIKVSEELTSLNYVDNFDYSHQFLQDRYNDLLEEYYINLEKEQEDD